MCLGKGKLIEGKTVHILLYILMIMIQKEYSLHLDNSMYVYLYIIDQKFHLLLLSATVCNRSCYFYSFFFFMLATSHQTEFPNLY